MVHTYLTQWDLCFQCAILHMWHLSKQEIIAQCPGKLHLYQIACCKAWATKVQLYSFNEHTAEACLSDVDSQILLPFFLHSGEPQFIDATAPFVIQGDTLTVNCCVMSFPQPTVSLSFNGTVLSASVSGAFDSASRLFRYYITYSTTAMRPRDEGSYIISATVTHGQPAVMEVFHKTVFVTIYGGPYTH